MSSAILIYVVCHDDASERLAHEDFDRFRWSRIIRIPNNQYFETNAFAIVQSLQHEWRHKYFVGLCQHTFFRKGLSGASIQAVDENIPAYANYDLLALSGRTYHERNWYHINIMSKLKLVLDRVGMAGWFKQHGRVPQFFNNSFLCRPSLMAQYCQFVTQTMQVVDTTPALYSVLDGDSGYKSIAGAPPLVQAGSGKRYYDWRAFVFERLPCFWFAARQARMKFLNFPDFRVYTPSPAGGPGPARGQVLGGIGRSARGGGRGRKPQVSWTAVARKGRRRRNPPQTWRPVRRPRARNPTRGARPRPRPRRSRSAPPLRRRRVRGGMGIRLRNFRKWLAAGN